MYYEKEQKIVHMTVEEFKKWEVPEGWKIAYMSSEKKYRFPGTLDPGTPNAYFDMRIILEKE